MAYLGHVLAEAGAAVLRPFGGHAVYLDAGAAPLGDTLAREQGAGRDP